MPKFYYYHAFLPLLLIICATILLDYFRLDLAIADHMYSISGNLWSMKESWYLEGLIHKGGRALVGIMLLLCLVALLSTYCSKELLQYRKGLGYLLLAVLASLLVVSTFKTVSNIDCPWSYSRYGGSEALRPILNTIFQPGTGRCFPAGHASGGYAWIALYFVCLNYWPTKRFWGLGAGLLLGSIFGVAQQMRGAHFLSHDLWTLAICWFIALIIAKSLHLLPNTRTLP